jgi:hypothetical protein
MAFFKGGRSEQMTNNLTPRKQVATMNTLSKNQGGAKLGRNMAFISEASPNETHFTRF